MSKKNHQNYTEPYAVSHPPIGRIRTIPRLNCRGGFHPPAQYQPTIIDQVRRIRSTPTGTGRQLRIVYGFWQVWAEYRHLLLPGSEGKCGSCGHLSMSKSIQKRMKKIVKSAWQMELEVVIYASSPMNGPWEARREPGSRKNLKKDEKSSWQVEASMID